MKNYNTVKRHFETVFKNHSTSNCPIILDLDGISITATYEDDNYIGFEGTSITKHGYCHCCGDKTTRLKQYKTTYTTFAVINGGQEATVLSPYTTMTHLGAIIVPPGYTDPVTYKAGGNPYSTSVTRDQGGKMIEDVKDAAFHQAKRTLEVASWIKKDKE